MQAPHARPGAVTTGPIRGSRKVYLSPPGHPGLRVPLREIALDDPQTPRLHLYDTSGPYTEDGAAIDLAAGLSPLRESWLAARGFETIEGRTLRPEDNGFASGERLVAACPAARTLRRGNDGQPVTQLEFARAGIVTEEMVYAASPPATRKSSGWRQASRSARRCRRW